MTNQLNDYELIYLKERLRSLENEAKSITRRFFDDAPEATQPGDRPWRLSCEYRVYRNLTRIMSEARRAMDSCEREANFRKESPDWRFGRGTLVKEGS